MTTYSQSLPIITNDLDSPVRACIDKLVELRVPQGIVVIGAGNGAASCLWSQCLKKHEDIPLFLIEGDTESYQMLEGSKKNHQNWHCSHSVITASGANVKFHTASIRSESGIFEPDLLKECWPNISELGVENRGSVKLNELLEQNGIRAEWLWINCLFTPSLTDFLTTAITERHAMDVVCLRVLTTELIDPRAREMSLTHLKTVMEQSGFEMIAVQSERNPMIGHALFARRKFHLDLFSSISRFGEVTPKVVKAIEEAIMSADVPEAVAMSISTSRFNPKERYDFLMGVATAHHADGDRMYANGLLNELSFLLDELPVEHRWHLIRKLIEFGQVEDAYAIVLRHMLGDAPLDPADLQKLAAVNQKWHDKIMDHRGHGHEVLISYLNRFAKRFHQVPMAGNPVLIEIGTTRENTAGQGSTRRLMEFCAKQGFHFITVDMDSANTEMASTLFKSHNLAFDAVHGKGEDYLAAYTGRIDAVFLDAYDFDHGMHSERRQARYVKFLGSRIDEKKCHQMHLECAQSLVNKLSAEGIVCVDDAWLDDGSWVAKGTLAVPYLIANGFTMLELRNKSVLLRRADLSQSGAAEA